MTRKASGSTGLTLPPWKRLRQSSEFEQLRTKGQRLAKGCLILNWLIIAERDYSRLGVVTSRKVGHSVVRSRARRLLRESFRLHQHELAQPVDMVLVARNSITGKDFAGVEKDFLSALKQARLLDSQ